MSPTMKNLDQFLLDVAEVLEVPQVSSDYDFRTSPLWGSMTGFALMVTLEQKYGVRISVEELLAAKTVADLASLAGVAA